MVEETLHSYRVPPRLHAEQWTEQLASGDLHPLHVWVPPRFERLGLLEWLYGTHVVTVGLDYSN